MAGYAGCALLLIAVLTWFFIWQVMGGPVKARNKEPSVWPRGELGYQIEVEWEGEIGELAHSFNAVSNQLKAKHNENEAWTRTLEQRVEQKPRELKRAHEQWWHTERMASIGTIAAVLHMQSTILCRGS